MDDGQYRQRGEGDFRCLHIAIIDLFNSTLGIAHK